MQLDKSTYFNKSKNSLAETEQLLSLTYKFTKDQKIFLGVIIKLYESLDMAINGYLFSINQKNIAKMNFEEKINMLKFKNNAKLSLSEEDFAYLNEVHFLYEKHKNSPIEFSRKEKFIISDDDYILHTLTLENLMVFFQNAKKIVAKIIMAA